MFSMIGRVSLLPLRSPVNLRKQDFRNEIIGG
jgi:hypothetical protein